MKIDKNCGSRDLLFLLILYCCFRNETLEAEPELEEDDGVYNITSVFNYDPETLTSPTNFVCDLTIPGTSYHLRKTEVYYPGEQNFAIYFYLKK